MISAEVFIPRPSVNRRKIGHRPFLTGLKGRIFIYEIELELSDDLSIKKYDGLSEEWLLMVQKNRTLGGIQHNFDIVQGPVANDKTARTIALYVAGIITAQEAIERLRSNRINDQVSIHTPAALSRLTITGKYQK